MNWYYYDGVKQVGPVPEAEYTIPLADTVRYATAVDYCSGGIALSASSWRTCICSSRMSMCC